MFSEQFSLSFIWFLERGHILGYSEIHIKGLFTRNVPSLYSHSQLVHSLHFLANQRPMVYLLHCDESLSLRQEGKNKGVYGPIMD